VRMTHNGVITTTDTIRWEHIDIIYVKPSGGRSTWIWYDHALAEKKVYGCVEETMIPSFCRVPASDDPFGLRIGEPSKRMPARTCPFKSQGFACAGIIPGGMAVCPLCMAIFVFVPPATPGIPRKAARACCAVATAVPPGAPAVTAAAAAAEMKKKKEMVGALMHGPRARSANSEFNDAVKACLNWRKRWDNGFPATLSEPRNLSCAARAREGCARWQSGHNFAPWAYGEPGVRDPGRQGFEDHNLDALNATLEDGQGSPLTLKLRVGICADDIEKLPDFNPRGNNIISQHPTYLLAIQLRQKSWYGHYYLRASDVAGEVRYENMRRLGGFVAVASLMPADEQAAAAVRELAAMLPSAAPHEAPPADFSLQRDPKLRRVDELPPSASRGAAGGSSSSSSGLGPVARAQSDTTGGNRNNVIDHRLRTEPASWITTPGTNVRNTSVQSNASSAGVGRYRDNYWDDRGDRQHGRPLPRVQLVPAADPPPRVDASAKRPAAVLTPATVSKARGSSRDPSSWSRDPDPLYDSYINRPLTGPNENSQRRWSSAPIAPPPPPAAPAPRWRWSAEWNGWVSY
jgi:hypothetical protein